MEVLFRGQATKLWCVAITTLPHPHIQLLLNSASKQNIQVHVLGQNDGTLMNKKVGYGKKLLYLYQFLIDKPKTDLLLCVDAYDVLFCGSAQEIVDAFDSYSDKKINVMFSGENVLFENQRFNRIYETLVPQPSQDIGPYSHACSGAFIGTVDSLLTILSRMPFTDQTDDQHYWILSMGTSINNRQKDFCESDSSIGMQVDTCARIAANIGCSGKDYYYDSKLHRFINSRTKTAPPILHFEGGPEVKSLVNPVYQLITSE